MILFVLTGVGVTGKFMKLESHHISLACVGSSQ